MDYVRVYISGAIAHHDMNERKRAFNAAYDRLLKRGYVPFNPFDNGLCDDAPYQQHMKEDIKMLLGCDIIYMLRGWESSNGAKLEFNVATSCGMRVMYE